MASAELLTALQLDDFVVIDFETTGFSPADCGIIEIGAVRFAGGEPAGQFSQLVNPGMPIPREIVDLTNISDDMVAAEPELTEVGRDFLDFVGESPLVAHNISFDLAFLKDLRRQMGVSDEVAQELYDTLPLARTFLFHRSGYSLAALCEYYGFDHSQAHRATQDALNTGHLFIRLVAEAASYPLPVIQVMAGVQEHVNLPNKGLYTRLLQGMTASGRNSGLVESQEQIDMPDSIYVHEGAGDDYGPQGPEQFFGPDGTLVRKWAPAELRPVQQEFSTAVAEAFDDGHIVLAEAGTGLGKSMAYLLPAINTAYRTRQPVVIACHTKHLQDQLFRQELPRLAEMLDAPVQAVMLKGRGNYLCRTRLQFALENAKRLLSPDDCEKILPIILWEHFTRSGDVDECPGFLAARNARLWLLLRSERGYCVGQLCQRYHGCFVGPLRRAVRQAGIVVVNHALLLADAAGDAGLLPPDYRLVIDEAHNMPKVATEQLTTEFSAEIVRELTDNYIAGRHRRIFRRQLQDALMILDEDGVLAQRAGSEAKIVRDSAGQLLGAYVRERRILIAEDERQRFQQSRYIDPASEFRGLEIEVQAMDKELRGFMTTLRKIHKLLSTTDMALPDGLLNNVESDLEDTAAVRKAFQRVAVETPTGDFVLWREVRSSSGRPMLKFRAAPLVVAGFLRENLFEQRPGTILCSATLQAAGSFDFFRGEIGLDSAFDACEVRVHDFPSPFFYEEQCAAFHWDTGTDVSDDSYPRELAQLIDDITDRIERRVLVLFTSYAQLRAVHEVLHNRLFRTDRKLLTQFARSSRWALLDAFKNSPRAILLGTSSFWEGIDLPGDLLEVLIMARLPFANPADPVVEARIEHLRDLGMNPFMDYQIPDAVTRFRQGFGRLIRSSYDEGIFIITDSRVSRRRYGEIFLDALPVQAEPFQTAETVISVAGRRIFQHLKTPAA